MPGTVVTLLVALCLVLAAVCIVIRARLLPWATREAPAQLATLALVAVFAGRAIGDFRYVGFFERVRGTRFARFDDVLYSPLCCLLACLIADAARL